MRIHAARKCTKWTKIRKRFQMFVKKRSSGGLTSNIWAHNGAQITSNCCFQSQISWTWYLFSPATSISCQDSKIAEKCQLVYLTFTSSGPIVDNLHPNRNVFTSASHHYIENTSLNFFSDQNRQKYWMLVLQMIAFWRTFEIFFGFSSIFTHFVQREFSSTQHTTIGKVFFCPIKSNFRGSKVRIFLTHPDQNYVPNESPYLKV